jgi:histone chaperone ASF1
MAKVNICNVVVKDNPATFHSPFQFEITFECIEDLNDDLEWKIIYVGCAESEDYDQTLDTVVVGPIIAGKHMFVFEADHPDVSKIPREDAVGVTVVLLTCGYVNQEFIRVGYYVNNEYSDPEMKENPPLEPDFSKLQRNILATCPRVTRFKIDWGDGTPSGGDGEQQTDQQNSENVPPPSANGGTESKLPIQESNSGSCSNGAAVAAGGDAPSCAAPKPFLMQDTNSMSCGVEVMKAAINGGAMSEPMQM